MASRISSRRVVVVSFIVDILDVVTNLVVGMITGSAVVFAEMAQGLADAIGSALLVVGERRAGRPRDRAHPFGYAREAYFWGLLSAVTMLVVGAGFSGWRGYRQLVDREPLEHIWLAVAVLSVAIVTNSYAVTLSARKLISEHGSLRDALGGFTRPLVKNALLRDVIGTSTSIVGLLALLLYQGLGLVVFDALGAIAAAIMMTGAALFLISQARALIAGRAIPVDDLQRVRQAIEATTNVDGVNQLAVIHAGASEVVVDADLELADDLETSQVEAVLDAVEKHVREVLPETERVRVLLNSPEDF